MPHKFQILGEPPNREHSMEPFGPPAASEVGQEFYKKLLDEMSDGVYFVDLERRILYWNVGAYRLTGYTAQELIGKQCHDNILCHVDQDGNRLCNDGCPLSASVTDGKSHAANVFLHHKDGQRVPVLVRVQPIRNVHGDIIGAIEIFSDDSAQVESRRKIDEMRRLALLDTLTELPNRRYLGMSARTAASEYLEHKAPFGILMIDIDRFKSINDTFGHTCGDRALQEVAKTLHGSLRPSDIVDRWGGDEFLAIVKDVNPEILAALAKRCVVMVSETTVPLEGKEPVMLSISVGGALIQPGESTEALIQRSDEMLYRSKESGRGQATTA